MNETASVPACVGIIMDGNRRFAKERGLPVYEGHSAGYKKLQEVVGWARDAGIPHVVAYAFSAENWQRAEEEVGYLMKLFRSVLENETERMIKERVCVRFVGDRSRFGEDVQKMMRDVEESTAAEDYAVMLHLLMSYGGRAEIVAAANALREETTADEEAFAKNLWSYPMPDPDIVIRTGGEKRLSGFLTWQTVYSELFFIDTFWPAFTKEEFEGILADFAGRERRRGK